MSIDKSSILLSYTFDYSDKRKPDANDKIKIGNLLSYADKIFNMVDVYKFKEFSNTPITLRIEGNNTYKLYQLEIDYVKIYFWQNNLATLSLKITPKTKELDDLYKINRALTQFYTKEKVENSYLYINNAKLPNITLKKDDLKKDVKIFLEKYKEDSKQFKKTEQLCAEILTALEQKHLKNTNIFEDKNLQLYSYLKENKEDEVYIKITITHKNNFTEYILQKYYPVYTPYTEEKKEYPFNQIKIDDFAGRVGFSDDEKEKIIKQNKDFPKSQYFHNYKRHYLYFDKQYEIVQRKKELSISEFIHYDTFITSLILPYVKKNKKFDYYDTFNPIGTNYINSYITIAYNKLDEAYNNNFVLFEPLLNSKKSAGHKINQIDFFNIYQSQVDIFTIGNSHSVVHILDKNSHNLQNNKETTHYYLYLFTTIQRIFILKIITSALLNIEKLNNEKNLYHVYKVLLKGVESYNIFLTNYNLKVISNSSSVDNSYHFFRKCNEIDNLNGQWNSVSFKIRDWKSILEHILQNRPLFLIAIFGIIGLAFKISNTLLNNLNDVLMELYSKHPYFTIVGAIVLSMLIIVAVNKKSLIMKFIKNSFKVK